jgi:hypothetical protein
MEMTVSSQLKDDDANLNMEEEEENVPFMDVDCPNSFLKHWSTMSTGDRVKFAMESNNLSQCQNGQTEVQLSDDVVAAIKDSNSLDLSSQVESETLALLMAFLEPGFEKTNQKRISLAEGINELNGIFQESLQEVRSLIRTDFIVLCKAMNAWMMLQTHSKFSLKSQSENSNKYICVRRKGIQPKSLSPVKRQSRQLQIVDKCICGYTISQKPNESLISPTKNQVEHLKECEPFSEQDVKKNFVNGVVTKHLGN